MTGAAEIMAAVGELIRAGMIVRVGPLSYRVTSGALPPDEDGSPPETAKEAA